MEAITSEQILDALESYETQAELIKDALDASSDVYILSDTAGRVLWCNEKCGGERQAECSTDRCALLHSATVEGPGIRQMGDHWYLIEQKALSNTRRMYHAKDVTALVEAIRNGELSIV